MRLIIWHKSPAGIDKISYKIKEYEILEKYLRFVYSDHTEKECIRFMKHDEINVFEIELNTFE